MKELSFVGIISNTGGHFRSISLNQPFRIERWPRDKIQQIFTSFEGPSIWTPDPRFDDLRCVGEINKTGHVVTASIQVSNSLFEDVMSLSEHTKVLENALKQEFRAIRLLIAEQVTIVAGYWFSKEANGELQELSGWRKENGVRSTLGGIGHAYAQSVNDKRRELCWPPKHKYVKLALEQWEHSLEVQPQHSQLISLVTALEALFNPGRTELRYRVARSAAVLLGEDIEHSRRIFQNIRKAYDLRSKIVHTGDTSGVEKYFFWALTHEVAESIKICWQLGADRDSLVTHLGELGFGSFRIENFSAYAT